MTTTAEAVQDFDQLLSRLRREFHRDLPDELTQFETSLDRIIGSSADRHRSAAYSEICCRAHKLKGAGLVLGLEIVAEIMESIETASARWTEPSICSKEVVSKISTELEKLRGHIHSAELSASRLGLVEA